MQSHGFLTGDANNKPKDAREKTSGLVDIGLIYDNRKLTDVGIELLRISQENEFTTDNFFQIPKDSYLYLKQLLKSYNDVNGGCVRPFIVLLYVLSKVDYLSQEEFAYLLPLCTNEDYTEQIIDGIRKRRSGNETVDDIIVSRLMAMDNYQEAMELWMNSNITEDLICEVGLNRKSRTYDAPYFPMYEALKKVFVDKDISSLHSVYLASKKINIGKWWRSYLFNTTSETKISRAPRACMNKTVFDAVANEDQFKIAFFKTMHLFKAKATLSDYLDLNRRYIRTTDVILFEDDTVKLDIVPKHFFNTISENLKTIAYTDSGKLTMNCAMEDIAEFLNIEEKTVIDGVNAELGTTVTTIAEAKQVLEDKRYERLQHLIDSRFTDDKILALLTNFENRNDDEIRNMVTDNADVPTIFEYVLGVLWYKVSERQGKILDYMKLSLDAELLPKTHAAGGEADIVYEYEANEVYPKHTMLLEATLADSTNQRHMEMEPVSRHLGSHLLRTQNFSSYCTFATNYLNPNVIADFKGRKTIAYYDTADLNNFVEGMKIIPLQTGDLKNIIQCKKTYREIYVIFDEAFMENTGNLLPHLWYKQCIHDRLACATRP